MSFYNGLPSFKQSNDNTIDGFGRSDIQLIKESILNIIYTHKGSRLMNPEYGTNIHKLIFEQNLGVIHATAAKDIEEAIKQYEPRAQLLEINTKPNNDQLIIELKLMYVEFDITDTIHATFNLETT